MLGNGGIKDVAETFKSELEKYFIDVIDLKIEIVKMLTFEMFFKTTFIKQFFSIVRSQNS